MKIIATTTQSINVPSQSMQYFLNEADIPYIPRQRKSLSSLRVETGAAAVIVWEETGPVLYIDDQKLFFHPSMAKNRLAAARKGMAEDVMARACSIKPGDSFLDCTLGMGADAIVASYFSRGQVTGLEKSPAIYYVIKWGMMNYHSQMTWLEDAIHRIQVVNADHHTFLKNQADDSFDIVYFDPMFRRPLLTSQPLAPLRLLADPAPLSDEAVAEACRVARKCVVMKETSAQELIRLGFEITPGSKHNKIEYGIIKV